jgi:hypothetical protein
METPSNTSAFIAGVFVFIFGIGFYGQAHPGERMSTNLFIFLLILSGFMGMVVKDWLFKPRSGIEAKTQYGGQQPDDAMHRKDKNATLVDLQSQDADIRAEAMTNLAILEDPDSVALLIPGLRDDDRTVRLRASEALAWVTGQDFGEDEEKWNEWWADHNPAQRSDAGDKKESSSVSNSQPKQKETRFKEPLEQSASGIKYCPQCKMKVFPKSDGMCPGCHTKII